MEFLTLDNYPSQIFTLRVDGAEYTILFAYNQLADKWSFSLWEPDEKCPLEAGRFVLAGTDLLDNVEGESVLLVLDRPGMDNSVINWYDRLTKPLSDGLPATLLLYSERATLRDLLADSDSGIIC